MFALFVAVDFFAKFMLLLLAKGGLLCLALANDGLLQFEEINASIFDEVEVHEDSATFEPFTEANTLEPSG